MIEIEAFIPDEYWKLTGCFTTDISEWETLGEKLQKWLDKSPPKVKGRSTGRTIDEKNQWLAERNSFSAELIEINGQKFKPDNFKDALETAEKAGFILDKKEEEDTRPSSPGIRAWRN